MPSVIWIAQVNVSARTAGKIRGRHHLDPYQVVEAILSPPVRVARWARDRNGRRQVLIPVRLGNKQLLVVLYPAGDDVWNLASAYEVSRD